MRPSACILCGKGRSVSFLLYFTVLYFTLLFFTLLCFTLLYSLYWQQNEAIFHVWQGQIWRLVNPFHSAWLYFTLLYSMYLHTNSYAKKNGVFLWDRGRSGWLLIYFTLLYSTLLYIYTILCFTLKEVLFYHQGSVVVVKVSPLLSYFTLSLILYSTSLYCFSLYIIYIWKSLVSTAFHISQHLYDSLLY